MERGAFDPPSEEKIRTIAAVLGVDADEMLAIAGRVSSDLLDVIRKRPTLYATLLRHMASDDLGRLLAAALDSKPLASRELRALFENLRTSLSRSRHSGREGTPRPSA
jgi:hypothetical protein